MKLAIMQPYLFPYLGYFQLIQTVEKFIIHDDVQFIKGGWINRNRLLVQDKEYLFTFSLERASSYLNINERIFSKEIDKDKKKLLKILKASYSKAPYYNDVMELVRQIIQYDEKNVSLFVVHSIIKICGYLGINTPFIISSELEKDEHLKNEARVINIVQRLGGDHYINPIGGMNLYSSSAFQRAGIKLNFIKTKTTPYRQCSTTFIPHLSIIDVLMFNSAVEVRNLLNEYELI